MKRFITFKAIALMEDNNDKSVFVFNNKISEVTNIPIDLTLKEIISHYHEYAYDIINWATKYTNKPDYICAIGEYKIDLLFRQKPTVEIVLITNSSRQHRGTYIDRSKNIFSILNKSRFKFLMRLEMLFYWLAYYHHV